MKICFTGDAIMLTPPEDQYWEENELQKCIWECDLSGTNLEMVLSGGEAFASTFCGGDWMTAEPDRLEYLKRFGFNHYGMANNHTMDYSYDGLRLTADLLDRNGLAHSGSGKDLASATQAAYVEFQGKKVAFITCTASCEDAARAGGASPSIPGRPGVNMLRHSEILTVKKEDLDVIDRVAKETCVNARFLKAVSMGIHNVDPKIHRFGKLQLVEGEKNEKHTYCNATDLKRIIAEIKKARCIADYVIVEVHSHDIRGETDDTPDEYLEVFAHECIDAGACAIVGTGTHKLKAIEVYKGCPIFYSLGNFMFVSEHMDYAPMDFYERYGVDWSYTLDDIWNLRSKNNTIGLEFDYYNYRSVVPFLYLENQEVKKVELLPIELGFEGGKRQKGFPYIADTAQRKEIFERLCRLSEPYRTDIRTDGDLIYINTKLV